MSITKAVRKAARKAVEKQKVKGPCVCRKRHEAGTEVEGSHRPCLPAAAGGCGTDRGTSIALRTRISLDPTGAAVDPAVTILLAVGMLIMMFFGSATPGTGAAKNPRRYVFLVKKLVSLA